jgi:glycolate oxidase
VADDHPVAGEPGDDTASDAGLTADLVAALGAESVLASAAGLRPYSHDASTIRGDVPVVVCLPRDTAGVAAAVRIAGDHGRAFVARGSGTGLAGGAVPVAVRSKGAGEPDRGRLEPAPAPVVISTLRMSRVLSVDRRNRRAWVQPGVLNLDLSRLLAADGLHFAPDPSSQQACTIGGNVANNSGGPHTLSAGVTSAHVLAVEVVLADGDVVVLGGEEAEPPGYDLRGAFVGSEGTMGVATAALVRLTPLPADVATLLVTFDDLDDAAACVSAVIAEGVTAGALEMMDGPLAALVEDFCGAGYPRDAAAVLLVELEGMAEGVAADSRAVRELAARHGAREVREARDPLERAALWKGRKSAFGAIARVAPDYYLHDTVVPRTRLVEVLAQVRAIAADADLRVLNVFHAGDGNLHPLLLFDAREPGALDRVHAAGERIVAASLAAGGVLSGEHGIGLEKKGHMADLFGPVDLEAQLWLRCAFDPDGRANPAKVLPDGPGCAEARRPGGSAAATADAGIWV